MMKVLLLVYVRVYSGVTDVRVGESESRRVERCAGGKGGWFVLPFVSVGPYLSGKVRQMHPRVSLTLHYIKLKERPHRRPWRSVSIPRDRILSRIAR
jgi:hypothetical protein